MQRKKLKDYSDLPIGSEFNFEPYMPGSSPQISQDNLTKAIKFIYNDILRDNNLRSARPMIEFDPAHSVFKVTFFSTSGVTDEEKNTFVPEYKKEHIFTISEALEYAELQRLIKLTLVKK